MSYMLWVAWGDLLEGSEFAWGDLLEGSEFAWSDLKYNNSDLKYNNFVIAIYFYICFVILL